MSSEVLSVPQTDFEKVIVQTADGNVTALAASDGQSLWIYDRSVPVLTLRGTSTPAVQQGVVVAGFSSGKLTGLYRSTLDWMFHRPLWGVSLGLLLPVLGFLRARELPEQFFPPADRDQVQVELELPAVLVEAVGEGALVQQPEARGQATIGYHSQRRCGIWRGSRGEAAQAAGDIAGPQTGREADPGAPHSFCRQR